MPPWTGSATRPRGPGRRRHGRRRQRGQPRHPAGHPPRHQPGRAPGPAGGAGHPRGWCCGRRAPLLLVATVVLSFAAALGVSALVFDHVFGFAGADPAFPLWTFVFLVALGTDYNIFLMTRVHEECQAPRHPAGLADRPGRHRRGDHLGRHGARRDLRRPGHPAAGVHHRDRLRGRLGVLLDTFVVRSVLVTALNLDVGRWFWWPGRLGRRRDVELGAVEEEAAALAR